MLVELAWCWLKYQPQSQLTRWFRSRFSGHGSRSGKIGIVALAGKLAIALWRVWMPPVWQEDFLTAVSERGILSVVCQAS